ncbi:MAG: response regulator transcription factor [Bacteroidia bacterium]|nr:response regulator transcription factor [Bacteroidia bacterium]
MNCLIVDDDNLVRTEVELLVANIPFLNLVESCSNAMTAFNVLAREKIDLIFLDVMMPEMSGLDFMKSLHERKPQIILMTSEKKYAVDGFNFDVTDFLVKPIDEARFLKAVSKARSNFENKSTSITKPMYLFAKVDSVLVKINVNDILYIEALADYASVHTASAKHVVHSTMKSIMEKLPADDFLRVHNSYIVRLDKISTIEVGTVIIKKNLIPVSRSHKDELMNRLKLL